MGLHIQYVVPITLRALPHFRRSLFNWWDIYSIAIVEEMSCIQDHWHDDMGTLDSLFFWPDHHYDLRGLLLQRNMISHIVQVLRSILTYYFFHEHNVPLHPVLPCRNFHRVYLPCKHNPRTQSIKSSPAAWKENQLCWKSTFCKDCVGSGERQRIQNSMQFTKW